MYAWITPNSTNAMPIPVVNEWKTEEEEEF